MRVFEARRIASLPSAEGMQTSRGGALPAEVYIVIPAASPASLYPPSKEGGSRSEVGRGRADHPKILFQKSSQVSFHSLETEESSALSSRDM